jgi:hypothetical protein
MSEKKAAAVNIPNDAVRETVVISGKYINIYVSHDDEAAKHPDIAAQVYNRHSMVNWKFPVDILWEVQDKPCTEIILKPDEQVLQLKSTSLFGTGMLREDFILYLRKSLYHQFERMDGFLEDGRSLLWITGPPGTGKSCTSLVYLLSIRILWIHYSRTKRLLNVVWIYNEQKKCLSIAENEVAAIMPSILETTSLAAQNIVFLDGYLVTSVGLSYAFNECIAWSSRDSDSRKFICVTSMSSIGKELRSDIHDVLVWKKKPSKSVNYERKRRKTEHLLEERSSDSHEESQALIEVMSWTMEEYKAAISITPFFEQVKDNLSFHAICPTKVLDKEEKNRLLEQKHFIAGGSARFMFDIKPEEAIKPLNSAIRLVSDIQMLALGLIGDRSIHAVNRLIARHDQSNSQLVSEYVLRRLASLMGPSLIEKLSHTCKVNPSVDGFLLEAWFFAHLSHNGIKWTTIEKGKLRVDQWKKSEIFYFDPEHQVDSSNDRDWFAPMKWNQGGYDALYLCDSLVRFVQITRANSHTFASKYFKQLLKNITTPITKVELYYVVPVEKIHQFKVPVNDKSFHRAMKLTMNCKSEVKVVGIDYMISVFKPSEGSQVI